MDELDEAWAKLSWAKSHYETLRREVDRIEAGEGHRFTTEVDADAGVYTFRIHDLPPVSEELGLIAGDCIHNLRTALDYLVQRV